MKITEYVNSDIQWNPPILNCDVPISKDIKEPLPSTSHFMAFLGAAGSGKTSAAIAWLCNPEIYRKKYHHIHIVMPPNSRASLEGDILKNHPPEKLHDDLTLEVLEFVQAYCETESSEKHYTLLFIDDCASSLKNTNIQKLLSKLVFNRRHLRLSIWIMAQSYNSLPLSLRKNISQAVIFRPRNKRELSTIFDELIYLNKDDQVKVANHVWDTPFNFLFIDTAKGKLHKNFNLLTLED
jgi:DNA replication protein DnaC